MAADPSNTCIELSNLHHYSMLAGEDDHGCVHDYGYEFEQSS